MDNAYIPSLHEVKNCLNISREIVCHYKHPTCLHKPVNNSHVILQRKPCKESCDSFYPKCEATIKSLVAMSKVNSYCQRLDLVRTLERIPECKEFPVKDIQKIEQCKLMNRSGKTCNLKKFYRKNYKNNKSYLHLCTTYLWILNRGAKPAFVYWNVYQYFGINLRIYFSLRFFVLKFSS